MSQQEVKPWVLVTNVKEKVNQQDMGMQCYSFQFYQNN